MCLEIKNVETQRQLWLKQLKDSPDGKIVRDMDGIIITDFDHERAPDAPKSYTYTTLDDILITIPIYHER